MANTSATGGPLTPNISPAPLEDSALVDFFQSWVVGITGLSGSLVRPRWQEEPPNIPDQGVSWVAIGITRRTADTFAEELHIPTGDGKDQIRRHEELYFLASFYGPASDENASRLREGMQVAQNREILQLNNMNVVSCEDTTAVPELLKEKWYYRVDLPFVVRRQIVREYPVLNLLHSQTLLDNEHGVTLIID